MLGLWQPACQVRLQDFHTTLQSTLPASPIDVMKLHVSHSEKACQHTALLLPYLVELWTLNL